MLNIFRFTSMLSAFSLSLTPLSSLHTSKSQPPLRREHLPDAFDLIDNIHQAHSLFNYMFILKPPPNIWHYHKLLTIIFKMGHYPLVVVLFKKMILLRCPVNQYFMSTIIECYCKINEVDLSFPVLGNFLKRGLPPDVVCFNSLIRGLFLQRNVEKAISLFKVLVRRRFGIDCFTLSIVLDGLCKAGEVARAWHLLGVAESRKWEVDVVAYNSMMDGFCKSGLLEDASALLGRMIDRRVVPNVVTYNIFIHGLCNYKRLDFACIMFSDLPSKGVLPNLVTYTVIIQGLCRGGRFQIAKDVLENMERDGFIANSNTCNIILDECLRHCNNLHSVNLLKKIVGRDFQLYASTFFVLMRRIRKIRRMNDVYGDDVINHLILKLISNKDVHESNKQVLIDRFIQKLY